MGTEPNFINALEELDAGTFAGKLSRAIADVALGVIEHNKKGKVVLTLNMERIGESGQVTVDHKVAYVKPTLRGKSTEDDTTQTPMYVNKNGHLSVAPDMQTDMFKLQEQN